MNISDQKKYIRSGKLKNSSEFLCTLQMLESLINDNKTNSTCEYLETISYLISLKSMTRALEVSYTVLIISMLTCDYSMKVLNDDNKLKDIRMQILKISNILSEIYTKSETKMKVTLKTERLICNLLNEIRELIKSTNCFQADEINAKLKILSKILTIAANTTFLLTLLALKNLIKDPLKSTHFPSFTNEKTPYLPVYDKKSYTLVLDLDETLVHVENEKLLIRPNACEFISQMSLHYELVLFTASTPMYADFIMSKIDPNNCIKLRLYRNHTIPTGGISIKNLDFLGRDLKNTIIVDNFYESFSLQPGNGIWINTWIGDKNDQDLAKIGKFLENLPYTTTNDVRENLNAFRQEFNVNNKLI